MARSNRIECDQCGRDIAALDVPFVITVGIGSPLAESIETTDYLDDMPEALRALLAKVTVGEPMRDEVCVECFVQLYQVNEKLTRRIAQRLPPEQKENMKLERFFTAEDRLALVARRAGRELPALTTVSTATKEEKIAAARDLERRVRETREALENET